MSNSISSINIGNVKYDINDESARSSISSIQTSLSGKQDKFDSSKIKPISTTIEGGFLYVASTQNSNLVNSSDNKIHVTKINMSNDNNEAFIVSCYPIAFDDLSVTIMQAQYIDYMITESGTYVYNLTYIPLSSAGNGASNSIFVGCSLFETKK